MVEVLLVVEGSYEFLQELPYIPRIGEEIGIEQLTEEEDCYMPKKGASCILKVTYVVYSNQLGNRPAENGWRVIVGADIIEEIDDYFSHSELEDE